MPEIPRDKGAQDPVVIYGIDTESQFEALKRRVLRERGTQISGLFLMGGVVIAGAAIGKAPAVAIFGLLGLSIGFVALFDAVRIRRRWQNLVVTADSVRLPMPYKAIGGVRELPAHSIVSVDLHEVPLGPSVEFRVSTRQGTRSVYVEKGVIFDWFRFVESLAELRIQGAHHLTVNVVPSSRAEIRNTSGFRALRRMGFSFGGASGLVGVIGLASGTEPVVIAVVGGMILSFVGAFLWSSRRIPLHVHISNRTVEVRTLTSAPRYSLDRNPVTVGAHSIRIETNGPRSVAYAPVDREIMEALESARKGGVRSGSAFPA